MLIWIFTAAAFCEMICCSGCASVRKYIEETLWTGSGVISDADYIRYQEMQQADELSDEGTFRSEAVESYEKKLAEKPSGTVNVSFARNDYISVDYYLDEALAEKIEGSSIWLNPGDAVYASVPVVNHPNSKLYRFSEFRIWTHDSAGKLKSLPASDTLDSGPVFRIPEDFSGTELSILPLGDYRDRTVTLRGGTLREDGSIRILENGFWEINGVRYGSVSTGLKAMESYRIVYDYSAYKDDWYFVSSDPEPYWDRASDGTITFLAEPSDEEKLEYTVLLHPYGSLTIRNAVSYLNPLDSILDSAASMFGNKSVIETQNIIDLVQVNGISVINNFSDTEVDIPALKAGDEVLIRLPSDLKLIADGLTLPAAAETADSREYRFTVPDSEKMDFLIDVSRRNPDTNELFPGLTAEHGIISVYDNLGLPYTEGSELPAPDEKITVEICPETDYCIYGKSVKNNLYRAEMKYSDFSNSLIQILREHPIKPGIIVMLDTEDELGECVFWTGNDMISGRTVLREGQDLQFDYLLDPDSGYEITLTDEEKRQIVNVWNPYALTRELEVTESLNGSTLHCRDFVTLKEGVVNNVPEIID